MSSVSPLRNAISLAIRLRRRPNDVCEDSKSFLRVCEMEIVAEFDDLQTNEEHSSARKSFSLRAFSEMQDSSNSAIIPQDLYKNPPSVVEVDKGIQQTSDDSVITRLTMGKMAAFEASQKATTTTARRFPRNS